MNFANLTKSINMIKKYCPHRTTSINLINKLHAHWSIEKDQTFRHHCNLINKLYTVNCTQQTVRIKTVHNKQNLPNFTTSIHLIKQTARNNPVKLTLPIFLTTAISLINKLQALIKWNLPGNLPNLSTLHCFCCMHWSSEFA